MPQGEAFPHLKLSLRGKFRSQFSPNRRKVPEIERNKQNRGTHVGKLRGALTRIGQLFRVEVERRRHEGLPIVDAGVGFVMRIPDGADPDAFAHALGVELVAETDGGFMLVATEDLSFEKLEKVLAGFEASTGGGTAASLLEVFDSPEDPHRIERLLAPDVLSLWPFNDDQDYVFDISIQNAEGTRSFTIPKVRKRRNETDDDVQQRKETVRMDALAKADEKWTAEAEHRFAQLTELVLFYGGHLLTGVVAPGLAEFSAIIRFPDSFQVRARVSGKGWKDIINLPNVFEVCLPEDVEQPLPPNGIGESEEGPELVSPDDQAPAVCVVDSGIQEGHIWLEAAIDTATSRCFLPGRNANDVQDEVRPSGHGTRVAGAVLYPRDVPSKGAVQPVTWLQNARVLDANNQIPKELPPPKYIGDVVAHFRGSAKSTRLYNHSVAANLPCTLGRMTTWATKIDELSHKQDVLFIQAAGNISNATGQPNNPGVFEHLTAEPPRPYPDYLEQAAARIANPAQSLQALTVGSVSAAVWVGQDKRSFATEKNGPSAFSRSGFGIWDAIKPEVVEIGGDYAIANGTTAPPTIEVETAIELVRTAGDGGPAVSKDAVGTSYAAPKVAHIAARLQRLLPNSSTLLYRGLIVHSARWPTWMKGEVWNADTALKLVGYGLPSVDRATENAAHRVTLITPDATIIRNQELHLYCVTIPAELRAAAQDIGLRIDVTLSYSSEPRRTRSSRGGYLATWLDWRSSGLGEPIDVFKKRTVSGEGNPARKYKQFDWCLHYSDQHGDATETQRGNGTVQKDWARISAHDLPDEFCIAIRAHKGWDHREGSGGAKYCLIVSIEAEDVTIPVYATVAAVNVEVEAQVTQEVVIPAGMTSPM